MIACFHLILTQWNVTRSKVRDFWTRRMTRSTAVMKRRRLIYSNCLIAQGRGGGRNGRTSDFYDQEAASSIPGQAAAAQRLWASCSHPCASTPTVFVTIWSRQTTYSNCLRYRGGGWRPAGGVGVGQLVVALWMRARRYLQEHTGSQEGTRPLIYSLPQCVADEEKDRTNDRPTASSSKRPRDDASETK